jgi:integrase
VFKDRKGFWVAEWEIDGKRSTRNTKLTIKAQAKKLRDQWKLEALAEIAAAEKDRVRSPKGKIIDQTINEAFGEYWQEVGQHSEGHKDIKADIERILGYIEKETGDFAPGYLDPQMMLSDIDTETIIGMREKRRKEHVKWRTKDGKAPIDKNTGQPKEPKPLSNRTVNITVGERMKWFLSYMAAKGRAVQAIQWDKVWLNEKPRHTEFTYQHEELLLRTYRKDHLPALCFALMGGPRRDQFVDLRWSQIDWVRMTITFKPLKKKVRKGQPRPPYTIPITKAIEDLLLSQFDPETNQPYHPEYVWTFVAERTYYNHKAGREYVKGQRYPLTYEGLGTEWARWKADHDLTDVRLHDLRHAHGERLAEACADPLIVRDGLNHGDLATTERYMGRVKVERIRGAMEAREKLDASRMDGKNPNQNPKQDMEEAA